MERALAFRKMVIWCGSVGRVTGLMGLSMSGTVAMWGRIGLAGITRTSTDLGPGGVFDAPVLEKGFLTWRIGRA